MKNLLFLIFYPWVALSASYSAVVMDANSSKIINAVQHTKSIYPASLTKLMTLFILFESLKKKNISLDTKFTVSKLASSQPASKLGVCCGQKISVHECIFALSVRSSNDIAVVVAENLAKSLKQFVMRMNQTAHRLHLNDTYFCNPSGWHHSAQRTTAKDMAILLRALWLSFPKYTPFLGMTSFERNKKLYRNTNKLQGQVPGMKMGKTGYTQPSGYHLATLTMQNNRPVIVVVMGMKSANQRNRHMSNIINTFYTAPNNLSNAIKYPR